MMYQSLKPYPELAHLVKKEIDRIHQEGRPATVRQIAAEIGVSPASVSAWRTGSRPISEASLRLLANYFYSSENEEVKRNHFIDEVETAIAKEPETWQQTNQALTVVSALDLCINLLGPQTSLEEAKKKIEDLKALLQQMPL